MVFVVCSEDARGVAAGQPDKQHGPEGRRRSTRSVSPMRRSVPAAFVIAPKSEQHLRPLRVVADPSTTSLYSLASDSAMTASDRSLSRIILGIDVSKAQLDVALLTPERPAASAAANGPVTEVSNTYASFKNLASWLAEQVSASASGNSGNSGNSGDGLGNGLGDGLEGVHACLEASGGYEQPVARWLHRQGATVSVVNPRRTSAYGDSQLRRSKTDRADARLLARFCQREAPAEWQPPEPEQEALREMSRGLERLKTERDRLQNQPEPARPGPSRRRHRCPRSGAGAGPGADRAPPAPH